MTIKRWIGQAAPVAKQYKFAPTGSITGVYTLLAGTGRGATFTSVTGLVSEICAGLIAAWNAATAANPELGELTVAVDNTAAPTAVILTAATPGQEVSVTGNATGGSGNATDQQQSVLLSSATGGTWSLTLGNQTTSSLSYSATASSVQSALTALSNVGGGNATVSGTAGSFTVDFGGGLAGTNPALLSATNGLSPGYATIAIAIARYGLAAAAAGCLTLVEANAGPNDVATPANWSGGNLPLAGDATVLEEGSSDLLYNLDALPAGLVSLDRRAGFTGRIGLPRRNSAGYEEFRPRYLVLGGNGTLTVSLAGDGGRTNLDLRGPAAAVNITGKGQRPDAAVPCTLLLLNHGNATLECSLADVGIAIYADETSTLSKVRQAYQTWAAVDTSVVLGSGVTIGTVEKEGGYTLVNCDLPTLDQSAGQTEILGSGNLTTVTLRGGGLLPQSSGGLGNITIRDGGTLDLRRDLRPKTAGTITLDTGAIVYDPCNTLAAATVLVLAAPLTQVNLQLGAGRSITLD